MSDGPPTPGPDGADGGGDGADGGGDGGPGYDAGPPEDEHMEFGQPTASLHYVFVVNTTLGTVARIDPGSLAGIEVHSIEVGARPTTLVVMPGTDNAVVLCEGSRSLSIIESSPQGDTVTSVPLGQPYSSIRLSPDGGFALAFFDQSAEWTDPDNAASKIAVVDLSAALAGREAVYEYAVGYRVTDVCFDDAGSVSSRALIVSRSEIAVADLGALETTWILPRVWIDNLEAEDVQAREVLCSPDARTVLVRSMLAPELTVVDIDAGLSARLPLHGIPTDLDLSPDGSQALAVMRTESVLTKIDLASDLAPVVEIDGRRYVDPNGDGVPSADDFTHLQAVDAEGLALVVGQAEVFTSGQGGTAALLYTNVARREELSLLDLDNMRIEDMGRMINKLVNSVVVAPGGRSALVIHRAEPNSADPDPLEREIDGLYGYTLIDLQTRATFQQVTEAPLGPLAMSHSGNHALLTVFDDNLRVNELHAVDLRRLTLQMESVPLQAMPRNAGTLPGSEIGYVDQEHPYGKITFIDLDSMLKRAVTGYELNADD
ncbi:MAG TPA: hypothetical protein VM425_01915 [Myxococcota bacterium]|nr:hypothetical protein [Myxococcota bacterium]